jgi:large subunit ribosomal protein L10
VLTRAQKEEQVATLREKLERATSVFVADYRGITVTQANQLRSKLKHAEAGQFEYQVVKNSVLRRAVDETDVAVLKDHFVGPSSIAISFGDPIWLAKTLVDYAKEVEAFELKGGCLDGQALSEGEVFQLATLPTLDELRGKLVGLLNAPATKLVRLLNEPGAQLARLVEARRGALEAGAEA